MSELLKMNSEICNIANRLANSNGIQREPTHEKVIFPQKLWKLVNDKKLDSAIKWSEDGRSIMIYEDSLKSMCLGKENQMFYTKKPKSFIRQLHLYGFKKVDKNQFVHKNFRRDRPDLIWLIKRSYRFNNPPHRENHSSKYRSTSKNRNTIKQSSSYEEQSNSSNRAQDQQEVMVDSNDGGPDFDKETIGSGNEIDFSHLDDGSTININNGSEVVLQNNYEELYVTTVGWYEGSQIDINYNYNDDNVLTLYNLYSDNK